MAVGQPDHPAGLAGQAALVGDQHQGGPDLPIEPGHQLDDRAAGLGVELLSLDELKRLAAELRRETINAVSGTGGHLGAGLGVVELTLALFAEYQFNARDKLVWDVGHQCYPHKLITGR